MITTSLGNDDFYMCVHFLQSVVFVTILCTKKKSNNIKKTNQYKMLSVGLSNTSTAASFSHDNPLFTTKALAFQHYQLIIDCLLIEDLLVNWTGLKYLLFFSITYVSMHSHLLFMKKI